MRGQHNIKKKKCVCYFELDFRCWVYTEPQTVVSHILDFVSGWESGKRLVRQSEQETNLRISNRNDGNVKQFNAIRCGGNGSVKVP